MPTPSVERKLAAIFAADVAGYSRLVGQDEAGTLARLKACRTVIDRLIADHRGRIFNTAGDSVVADFASAVDAVQCAVAVQRSLADPNLGSSAEPMLFRIGVHVGDVVVDGADLLGDGVNIAARLEGLAEPGAICISAAARDHIGNKLPLAFDDLGEQQVKNIAQAIRVYRVQLETPAAKPAAPLPLPDKPSIAVLPFQNMSGDPEQEYFADGMVEEIITALSRIRWLFVIARNSSFTYKGQAVDVKQVGRDLGVRYVLEGSVRKAANRVRITAQLIEVGTGAHLWADRFDGSLEDVFELQDKVAISVAGVIEPALQAAETARSANRPTSDLTAYDLYLRACGYHQSYEKNRVTEAIGLLDKAIERDPRYGSAFALAASYHLQRHLSGWADAPAYEQRTALVLARQALRLTADDAAVLGRAAYVLGHFGENINAAMELVDRALILNPSFALGWYFSGNLRLWAGQPEVAIEHANNCIRLSPRDPLAIHSRGVIGVAHFLAHRFDEAAANLGAAHEQSPGWVPGYRWLAACYAQMGRLDEANEVVRQLRALTPIVVNRAAHLRDPEHRELYLSGLRLAAGDIT